MDACVACGRSGHYLPYWPGLLRCGFCTHCIAATDVASLNFSRLYDESYFSGDEYANYLGDRSTFDKQFWARLKQVLRYQKSGRMIEIGCAFGFFLNLARDHFDVQGYEISQAAARYAATELGLDVRCADFSAVDVAPGTADVIVMWDVIEHLPRPDLTILKAGEVLGAGAHLFLTTGDIGSALARLRREKWRLVHPPTHLQYFTRKSITQLLERAGLSVVNLKYCSTRRSIRQVAYSLCMLGRKKRPRLYRRIDALPLADLSFALNTYDIMFVAARKTH